MYGCGGVIPNVELAQILLYSVQHTVWNIFKLLWCDLYRDAHHNISSNVSFYICIGHLIKLYACILFTCLFCSKFVCHEFVYDHLKSPINSYLIRTQMGIWNWNAVTCSYVAKEFEGEID